MPPRSALLWNHLYQGPACLAGYEGRIYVSMSAGHGKQQSKRGMCEMHTVIVQWGEPHPYST